MYQTVADSLLQSTCRHSLSSNSSALVVAVCLSIQRYGRQRSHHHILLVFPYVGILSYPLRCRHYHCGLVVRTLSPGHPSSPQPTAAMQLHCRCVSADDETPLGSDIRHQHFHAPTCSSVATIVCKFYYYRYSSLLRRNEHHHYPYCRRSLLPPL